MGFGNQALLWFWAWRGRSRREARAVLRTPAMAPWLELFPRAVDLTVARSDVGFLERRPNPSRIPGEDGAPAHTIDWAPGELTSFVTEVLLSSPRFRGLVAAADVSRDDVVVNIRRGDYYAAENVGQWGFDQVGFVRDALAAVDEQEPVGRVLLVSDDPQWCRDELGRLADDVGVLDVVPADDGPELNLATLVAARRLVVTNSTFSYWGGYIGDVHHGPTRQVWAPWLFDRTRNDGRSWLLDPAWSVLEDPSRTWSAGPA
jgi:hypothetical protein